MIERIVITDFAVARSVTIEPGPGLNVFTGETGAGKSLAVDAVAFAFGARRGKEVVASGAERATVEVTWVEDGKRRCVERSVGLSGRSTVRLDGQPATLAEVQPLAERLVDIHGQSEQLSVLRPSVQLQLLDEFGGFPAMRSALGARVREVREVRRQVAALATDSRERERLVEQLSFEANEIEAAALEPGEDERLRADQSRLANAGRLIEASTRALAGLESDEAGEVLAALGEITGRDTGATEIADLAALYEAATGDLGRALRHYRDGIDTDPEALAKVEERLDLIARLRRKYGDSVEEILSYGREARGRLASLTGAEGDLDSLRAREEGLLARIGEDGGALSRARREAAGRLVGKIAEELESLGMGGAALAVGFAVEDDADGAPVALPDYDVVTAGDAGEAEGDYLPRAFGEDGFDRVEFLASFNPGESPRPLAMVASGGETSRFLLALATVLGSAAEPRLVVFDEVDEGVGGRAGALVGEALSRLAERHQVFCITHLPQVAAFGDLHFVVTKDLAGAKTESRVETVEGDARATELASMFGGVTEANVAAARDLLAGRG